MKRLFRDQPDSTVRGIAEPWPGLPQLEVPLFLVFDLLVSFLELTFVGNGVHSPMLHIGTPSAGPALPSRVIYSGRLIWISFRDILSRHSPTFNQEVFKCTEAG